MLLINVMEKGLMIYCKEDVYTSQTCYNCHAQVKLIIHKIHNNIGIKLKNLIANVKCHDLYLMKD